MELVQSRIVTDDVEAMATFYATLVGVPVTTNEFYVEVPTGSMSVGFSKRRFTEEQGTKGSCSSSLGAERGDVILDFVADDVEAQYLRIQTLGVHWVMPPTTQPWGRRSMLFRDPEGHLVNVFSRHDVVDR
jgi:predicted enzyme related to lactoylglutathione lyase